MRPLLIIAALALAACGEDSEPTSRELTAIYNAVADEELAKAEETYGSIEDAPQHVQDMALTQYEVDVTDCEKAADDRGFLCVVDIKIIDRETGEEVAHSPLKDEEIRVAQGSDGWQVSRR